MKKSFFIDYEEYSERSALSAEEQHLVALATASAGKANATYSQFYVGAAIALADGVYVTGNNQENPAYPSSMCAERVALYAARANYPDKKMISMAVVALDKDGTREQPAMPCGACRQVMNGYEEQNEDPVSLICAGRNKVLRFNSFSDVLPFAFGVDDLE